jgi:coenzyme F420-reducing hydrogenase alpha subunit
MSKIDEESLRRIANRMEEAAETARRAAESISESVQRMSVMFEDGYGGNALKLIELMETEKIKGGA